MNINLKDLQLLKSHVLKLHQLEVQRGKGNIEFSWYTTLDTVTGEFSMPVKSDSVGDSAVTTTSTLSGGQAVDLALAMADNPNLIYVWGHSHNVMGTNPSITDINTIKDHDLALSMISNNYGEMTILIQEEGEIYEMCKYSASINNVKGYKQPKVRSKSTGRRQPNAWYNNYYPGYDVFDDGYCL